MTLADAMIEAIKQDKDLINAKMEFGELLIEVRHFVVVNASLTIKKAQSKPRLDVIRSCESATNGNQYT